MIRNLLLAILAIFIASQGSAQVKSSMNGAKYCSMRKSALPTLPRLEKAVLNGPLHSFDVLDYKLNLKIYDNFYAPYPHTYNATNIITFKVDSTLSSIKLNAVNTSLVIDSVRLAGTSFTHSGDILTIQLNRSYAPGEIVQVKVIYHHLNEEDGAFFAQSGTVFTDCEPEGARKWFPCWDRQSDKATLDLTVKVPLAAKLGSNGALADSSINGDTLTYHWVSSNKISTYLMVMSARLNYNLDIINWHKISNPDETVPLRFYYNPGENPHAIEGILGDMTTYYSEHFCEHPFQKNGFASLNNEFVWGGMENQTLTSICPNCWSESLVSHEYAHQWFGDLVTCATWADIWVNEGFATWTEAFWIENSTGYDGYKSEINQDAIVYLQSNPGWAISVPSWAVTTPNSNTLFNYYVTYAKGACALHQVRYLLGDSLFFRTLQSYVNDTNLRFGSATVADFNMKVNEVTGQNYDWYFNDWIFQPNHPTYDNTYNVQDQGAGEWVVNFFTTQVQGTQEFFRMMLELRVVFEDGTDSIFRVMNNDNYQQYSFLFNKKPIMLYFDPNNQIVLKHGTTVVGTTESEKMEGVNLLQNIPNPAGNSTRIVYEIDQPQTVTLEILDVTGRILSVPVTEFKTGGKHSYDLNCSSYSPGIYYYRLKAGNHSQTRKMVISH
jgi:aminopeptidase N